MGQRLERISEAWRNLLESLRPAPPEPIASHLFRVALHADMLLNALLDGYPDELLSSRAGKVLRRIAAGDRREGDWGWCLLCRVLDLFQRDHCLKSIDDRVGKPD